MAVAGAPRIVTQTSANLRVSHETEAGFVQQASTGLAPAAIDGEIIHVLADRIIVRNIVGGNTSLNLYDLDLNLLDTYNCPTGIIYTFAYSALDSLFIGSAKVGNSGTIAARLSEDRNSLDNTDAPNGFGNGTTSSQVLRFAISPDGQSAVATYSGANCRFYRRSSSTTWVQQTRPTGLPGGFGGDNIEWARDSQFVFIEIGNTVAIVSDVGGVFSYITSINVQPNQTVHRIAMSPDNVFLAISTVEDDGGLTVYRTRLFKRGGEDFLPVGGIDGFGSSLSWNELGNQLYDAGTRRAFRRTPNTNTFVELPGFMDNIPAGVLESATSPHVAFPVGATMFFDGMFFDIVTGAQGLDNLGLALLDVNYVFDSAETEASAILAVHEVYGGNWPQGGKELTNVQFKPYGTQGAYLDADDVMQMIYGGSVTARWALVYDVVTDAPVAIIDFQQEVIAELNSRFTLKMGDFGFVLISP